MIRDGVVAVVKHECATCEMVAPVLGEMASMLDLEVYTQYDPAFPAAVAPIDDTDLAVSYRLEIETVPTLVRFVDGVEVDRTVGWHRERWEALTGLAPLGADLPVFRPGCGSMTLDFGMPEKLAVKYGGARVSSRRIEFAALEDEFEAMFDRGFTDGLPVVPPTPERVFRMLDGTSRASDDVVCVAPPDLVECTVEKIAINAVMAGCRPEYLPVVIAALEAACTDQFNIHGVLATTMPVGPVIIVNGPIARAIGMNSGGNVFGQGNRANLTIGRAVQLVIRNMGGGRPGGVDRATHGNPGKVSFCFAEDEATSPWTPLSVQMGRAAGESTVTLFAGEGPRCIVDQKSRTPESLTKTMAACLRTVQHPKLPLAFDAVLVIGPEHARVYAEAGWSRERVIKSIHSELLLSGADLVVGAHGMAEGIPAGLAGTTLPKFREGWILLVHAGGAAGLFSAVIGGWANGAVGSAPVIRSVVA
jgi:thiol-disulfide isomerase/thioredoxin